MSKNRVVVPTRLPIVLRRCHMCASGRIRVVSGEARVLSNHGLVDAWLLALCRERGDATGLTVPERMEVRSVLPELLCLPCHFNPGPTGEPHQGRDARRREVGVSRRTARPAWQSPYGPPPHRTCRGRWAAVPGAASSRSASWRAYLRGRGD